MRAIFLDRDGVINKKMPAGDYVKRWGEFEFLPGAIEAIRTLAQKNFEIFIVTNQRGIARGLMTHEDLCGIHAQMLRTFHEKGISIRQIYYCPHDENECKCRKPAPGMLLKAANDHNLNLRGAILIGDSISDMQAAQRAGCTGILVNEKYSLLSAVREDPIFEI